MESEQSHISQEPVSNDVKSPVHKTAWFKWFTGAVIFVAFLLFGFSSLTAYLAGIIIKNQVATQTNNTYELNFDRIQIKWSKTLVILKNTTYERTDNTLENNSKATFDFTVDKLEIKLKSILDIYFEHSIYVEHVKVSQPQLRVIKNDSDTEEESFSLETGDLYKVLQGFVKSFRIDNLQVNQMKLEYTKNKNGLAKTFKMNDLSFKITNFKLDSATISSNTDLFFTENFDLVIKDQWIVLSDNVHQMHFDSLKLSTKTNNIELFNTQLDTIGSAVNQSDKDDYNQYHLNVPYTGVIGLDFAKAYHQNELHIDSIVLRSPSLSSLINSVSMGNDKIEVDTTIENRIVNMVLGVFNKVELDRFNLQNASFKVEGKQGDQGQLSGVNLEFFTYVIDSNDLLNAQYMPQVDGLILSVEKPEFSLPSKNILKAKHLDFSTFTGQLTIDSVLLKSGGPHPEKHTSILLDQLTMKGLSLEEILESNELRLDEIKIKNPEIRLVEQKNAERNFTIESLLRGKLKGYYVDKIRIVNGKASYAKPVSMASKQRVGQFNLTLSKFKLNEKALKKEDFLYSDNVQLSLRNAVFFADKIQHQLAFKTIKINTKRQFIEATNTSIRPVVTDSSSLTILANGSLDKFQIQGVDFNNLENLDHINLSKLVVSNADLSINKLMADTTENDSNKSILSKLQSVDLQNIKIDDVNILFQDNGKSIVKFSDGFLHAKSMTINESDSTWSDFNFNTDSINYGATRIVAPLSKMNHIINLESVHRRYDSSFTFSGISIRPIPGKRIADTSLKLVAYVPEIYISNSLTLERRRNDSLLFGDISIKKPRVKLQLPLHDKDSDKTGLQSYLTSAILGQFNSLSVHGLNIVDGSIELKNRAEEPMVVNIGKVNLSSSDWTISKTSIWEANKFLWASDFEARLSDLSYSIPGFDLCHKIDSVQYTFKPNDLIIHGIYINSVNDAYKERTSKYSAYLPEVNVTGFDFYRYLNDSIIDIHAITSKRGFIEASLYPKGKEPKKPFDFPSMIPDSIKGFKQLNVSRLSLEEMDAQAVIHYADYDAPLEMDFFNLKVDSFSIEPGLAADTNRLLWSKNIEFDAYNVYTTIDQGLSEIGADELHVSTEKDSIGIKYPSYVPTVYRYEYALHKGFQTNVFTINGKNLGISNLNFHKLLYDKVIEGDSIVVNRPSIIVLKDKRIPAPAYKFKKNVPQLFKDLKIPVSFNGIKVNDMHVKYEEFAKNGRKPGDITLTHMNIEVKNVTNDSALLQNDSILAITMNSMLLDQGRIDFDISYDMLSKRNDFSMNTTVGEMDATLFNEFVEPVYFAKINSGNVVSMDMSAIGNDSISGGKMGLYYNELNFSFVDAPNDDSKGFSARLKSTIGNMVVHTENKNRKFKRRQPVFFKRDTNKGWINYLIKIELSGVESSVGLNNHKKEVKKANKKLWKEFNKKDRKARKARAKLKRKSEQNN